jgi:RES domain-containing protein
MPVAWRLTSARRAPSAFTGDGSVLEAGRWHRQGTRCVYASSSLSLSALEVIVHAGGGRPARPFVSFQIEIPDDLPITQVPVGLLVDGWRSTPGPVALADFGSAWVRTGETSVLRVPSAVTPTEWNYLLNPVHPDFKRIRTSPPVAYEFDRRILPGTA